MIPGTEGHPGYDFKIWMRGYALPEYLLQWQLLLCPVMALLQAGLAVLPAVLSFGVFHILVPGILFSIAAAGILVLLVWITWIRRQYAFDGGRIMEQVH